MGNSGKKKKGSGDSKRPSRGKQVVDQGEGSENAGTGNRQRQHPIRPNAEDCSHFLRTGTCKFGPICKFNHPVSTKTPVDQGNSSGNGVENSAEDSMQVPCKFYLDGLCRYGEACNFHHSEAENPSLELNILGFPIRSETTQCAFYMRTGYCGYGVACRYHHPDPIFLQPGWYSSAVNGESMDNHQEDSGTTGEGAENYLLVPLTTSLSFLQVHPNWVFNGYQAPGSNQEVGSTSAPPNANAETVEDHYDDPPDREPCDLNDVGLPIRPGNKACWNYENLGLCKSGRACAYNHPEKPSSTDASTSESESPSGDGMFQQLGFQLRRLVYIQFVQLEVGNALSEFNLLVP